MRLLPIVTFVALLPVSAAAAPSSTVVDSPPGTFEVLLDGVAEPGFDETTYELLLEDAVGRAPLGTHTVGVLARGSDGVVRPLEEFLPPPAAPPTKDDEPGPGPARVAPVDLPGVTPGFLSDRAVYLSQCHGWIWFESLGGFSTQRGNLFDTVEDFHNPEGLNQYLLRYLENAGAAVFTVKERDMTSVMAIADNDGTGYSETGGGFVDGPAGFAEASTWLAGTDPFDAGTTRRVEAASGSVATWTPDVPTDGVFAVYTTWDSDSEHAPDAHYRITHPGGVIDQWFDQTTHGSTWQHLETLWLPGGVGGLTVELIADSAYADRFVDADAVRVGGGMGDVQRMGDLSGRPRWEEGANLHTQWNGAPTSVYDPGGSGNGSDVGARSRWAAWEHPASEDAVYLSWHSNAGGGTGTVTLTYDGTQGGPTAGSEDFAGLLQDEIVDAVRTLWDSEWSDRGVYGGGFGELNPSHNPEMPAALVELGFHDHAWDTALLKEPRFRRDASRAMYRGVVRYFAERDGVTPTYLPEPPTHLAIRHGADERLEVTWQSGPSGAPFGDAATSWRVFASADGRSWDNGIDVSEMSAVLDVDPDELVFVRVAALNAGGASFPTEVLGARRSWDGTAPLLVVDAYDRLQASQLPWEAVGGALGDLRRMVLPRMNGYDTTVRHALAVDALGWPFESATDEATDTFDLSDWDVVLWAAGEESTTDESLSDLQQDNVAAFVAGGGALWTSGSEVLWDLDAQGSADDRAFAAEVLGATMASDDSGTTTIDGVGLLAGLELDFGLADGAEYDIDYPDVLDSDLTPIAEYEGGGVAAVLQDGVSTFGIPFESIGDPGVRAEVAARILGAMLPDYVPPTDPGPGDDDDATSDDDDDGTPDDDDSAGDDDDDLGAPPLQGTPRNMLPQGDTDCACSAGSSPSRPVLFVVFAALATRRRRLAPGVRP